jgi:hypothetical protein
VRQRRGAGGRAMLRCVACAVLEQLGPPERHAAGAAPHDPPVS